ncbi:EamA family transporter [Streptomyces sp. NA04227]|uniref:EamA family transporter n=1 Tax=Streptomyces sp. NA04227 TaxID=2742136 RepID=UPI0015921CC6|nr:EamA family transporter [Streptomyces sp. NA04227]QKW07081.1 EamA family transporter [Streptomyces sp. NA04227]
MTALAPALWGSTYLVTTELLPPGRPLLAATMRALPAGLLLLLVTRRLPKGDWWWRAAVLGALNIAVFLALLFVAAYRLPGGVAATVASMQPLLVAVLAAVLLGERLRAWTLLCGLAGAAGVALLVLRADARLDPIGVAAALGSAVVMAVGLVLGKRWVAPAPLLAVTGWQLTAGGVLLLPVMLAVEGPPPAHLTGENWAGFAYLCLICTALTYVLWFRGLGALPATRITFLSLLSPLVATVLGWLVLGQGLTAWQLLGAVVVLGALAVAQRPAPGGKSTPGGESTTVGRPGTLAVTGRASNGVREDGRERAGRT